MKKLYFVVFFLMVLVACRESNQHNEKDKQNNNTNTTGIEEESALLLPKEFIAKFHFSDSTTEDVFKLEADGFDPLQSNITFTISNSKGELLYSESFKSDQLIDDKIFDITQNPTVEDKKKYAVRKMKTFFESNSFSLPAIPDEDEFTDEYSDRAIWDDIKSDKSAVGFYYLLGAINGKSIAYSKKQKKVVVYFTCC